ncbi:MAG: hypothetical protein AABZ32_01610, partial [Bacteroidota bacterium]
TVDGKGRINYPSEFIPRVAIIRAIKKKHDEYGVAEAMLFEDGEEMLFEDGETMLHEDATSAAVSPLTPYLTEHGIDLGADAANVTASEVYEALQLDARRDAELKTQAKNNSWNPVVQHLHDIGDYLMKLHNGSQKKLGDYGFTVDDSPRAPKERISIIKLLSQITLKGIVIGSTLTNVGTTLVHIYKGTSTAGTPIVVNPNEKLGMTKGFSAIIVLNPSALESAKVKTLMTG